MLAHRNAERLVSELALRTVATVLACELISNSADDVPAPSDQEETTQDSSLPNSTFTTFYCSCSFQWSDLAAAVAAAAADDDAATQTAAAGTPESSRNNSERLCQRRRSGKTPRTDGDVKVQRSMDDSEDFLSTVRRRAVCVTAAGASGVYLLPSSSITCATDGSARLTGSRTRVEVVEPLVAPTTWRRVDGLHYVLVVAGADKNSLVDCQVRSCFEEFFCVQQQRLSFANASAARMSCSTAGHLRASLPNSDPLIPPAADPPILLHPSTRRQHNKRSRVESSSRDATSHHHRLFMINPALFYAMLTHAAVEGSVRSRADAVTYLKRHGVSHQFPLRKFPHTTIFQRSGEACLDQKGDMVTGTLRPPATLAPSQHPATPTADDAGRHDDVLATLQRLKQSAISVLELASLLEVRMGQ